MESTHCGFWVKKAGLLEWWSTGVMMFRTKDVCVFFNFGIWSLNSASWLLNSDYGVFHIAGAFNESLYQE